jgi:hypothetical protein
VKDPETLADARDHCSSLGKTLSAPSNECELEALGEFTSHYHAEFALGGEEWKDNYYWLNIQTTDDNHPKTYNYEGR